jgi:flagellar basal body-associated protein FliL
VKRKSILILLPTASTQAVVAVVTIAAHTLSKFSAKYVETASASIVPAVIFVEFILSIENNLTERLKCYQLGVLKETLGETLLI